MADNINYSKIVKNIKKEVVKHLDKVVKNQNCMLCAWCTELQARGKDTLPRPVHSPRDVIFSLGKNNTIVLDPKIEKFKDKKDLENKIKEIPNSRFYVHVDWKNGGGHEFIAINKNGNAYAVDSQDGIIKKLNLFLNDKYIDFKKSYTFRTDDKKINNNILKYNNMKYYIPWNDNDKKILKQDSKRRITMSNLIKEDRRKIVKDDNVNEGEKFVGKDLRLSELKKEKNLMGVILSLADDSELYVAVSPYQDLDTTFYTTSSIDISNKYVLIGEADELTVRDCQLNNIEMFDTQEDASKKLKEYYKKMIVKDSEIYNDGTYLDVKIVGMPIRIFNFTIPSTEGNSVVECDLEFVKAPVALRNIKGKILSSGSIDILMKGAKITLNRNVYEWTRRFYNVNESIRKLIKEGKDIRFEGNFGNWIDNINLGSVPMKNFQYDNNIYTENRKIDIEKLNDKIKSVLSEHINYIEAAIARKSIPDFNSELAAEINNYLKILANSSYRDSCTKDGDVNDTYLEDDTNVGGDISVQPNGDVIVTIEYEGNGGDNSTSKVKLDKSTFFEMVNEMYDYKYDDIDDTNELLKALDNEPNFNDMENEFWKKVYEIDLDNAQKELEEAEDYYEDDER